MARREVFSRRAQVGSDRPLGSVDAADCGIDVAEAPADAALRMSRRHAQAILTAWGSHPAAVAASLSRLAAYHPLAASIIRIGRKHISILDRRRLERVAAS